MTRLIKTVTALVMLLLLNTGTARAASNDYTYIAENAAPQNYLENGVLKGYAAELLMAMWNRMGVKPKTIQFLPWDKAYQLTLTQPKTVLLTTSRLEERETLFKWVGPISTPRFSFFADSARDIKITSLDDARKYRVGTVINDAAETILLKRKFTKEMFDRSPDIKTALERLRDGKCDLFVSSEASAIQSLKLFGFDTKRYVNVLPIAGTSVFFAFHKDTPDRVIKEFQDALNALKADGTYKKIRGKYGFSD